MMIQKRHPARRGFEKAEDRRQVRRGEGAVQLEIEEVAQMSAALAGVDADRQAEFFRFGVDREEVRVIESQRADDAAEENADGAVLFGIMHLFDGCID